MQAFRSKQSANDPNKNSTIELLLLPDHREAVDAWARSSFMLGVLSTMDKGKTRKKHPGALSLAKWVSLVDGA